MAIANFSDIAGLVKKYDSRDLSTITKGISNELSLWKDSVAIGEDFSIITGTPTHGARLYNGHAVIDVALGDTLDTGTIAARAHPKTVIIFGGYDTHSDNSRIAFANNFWWSYLNMGSSSSIVFSHNKKTVTIANVPIQTNLFTYTVDTSGVTLQIDQTPKVVNNVATTMEPDSRLMIGQSGTFDGWIGMYLMYDTVLSDAQILDVQDLIIQEWADNSVYITMSPPSGWDYIQTTTTTVPTDSILFGDTFAVGDQVAYETTATHTNGSSGTVVLDVYGVPTITGTSASGTWTFQYKIKDANGDNTILYTASITVA